MRLSRYAAGSVWLGVAVLTGCHGRVRVAAAPPPPRVAPVMVSVPPPSHPAEPVPHIPLEEPTSLTSQLPRKPLPRFRPLRATREQLAALNPPPVPVDLGQLTAGGQAVDLRQQTETLLRGQQKRLAELPQVTAAAHSQQVQQAMLFLRQADEAWRKLDLEGAKTLATKAKVLLDEIQA